MFAKNVHTVVSQLKQITAGCVANSITVSNSKGTATVSGFVNLPDRKGNTLEVAMNWTKAGKAESLVVEIDAISGGGYQVAYFEQKGSIVASSTHADELLADFMQLMEPKVLEKVKTWGQKKGGAYTGRRLEAWPEHKNAPRDRFNEELGTKFTQELVDRARNANITYK